MHLQMKTISCLVIRLRISYYYSDEWWDMRCVQCGFTKTIKIWNILHCVILFSTLCWCMLFFFYQYRDMYSVIGVLVFGYWLIPKYTYNYDLRTKLSRIIKSFSICFFLPSTNTISLKRVTYFLLLDTAFRNSYFF